MTYQVVRVIPEIAEIVIAETSTLDEALDVIDSQPEGYTSANPNLQPRLIIKEI